MNLVLKEKCYYRKEKLCSGLKKIFGILILMLMITACSSEDAFTENGNYFVCSSSAISNAGVLILNPQGEKVLELPDSFIVYRISKDGIIMQPEIGELPADDRLVIEIESNLSENEAVTGVWGIGEEGWLIELQPGRPAISYHGENEQLGKIYLGDNAYDRNFNIIDIYDETKPEFKVSENLILGTDYDENGNSCLANQDGNIYLTSEEFKEKNPFLQDLYKNGVISLKETVPEKYLLIYYEHETETEPGKYLINTYSALCDLDGVIQYPELAYTSAGFPIDQYERREKSFIEFRGKEEDSLPDYLNLSTDELVDFPEGCSDIRYKGNGLFLLEKDSEYTIFAASVNQTGSSFGKDENLLDFTYVFGLQSYVISTYSNRKVVIDDIEREVDSDNERIGVSQGEYPIIKVYQKNGGIRTCYVLTPEGSLLLETPKVVIYANERYYVYKENDEYHISEMVQFNTNDSFLERLLHRLIK